MNANSTTKIILIIRESTVAKRVMKYLEVDMEKKLWDDKPKLLKQESL